MHIKIIDFLSRLLSSSDKGYYIFVTPLFFSLFCLLIFLSTYFYYVESSSGLFAFGNSANSAFSGSQF